MIAGQFLLAVNTLTEVYRAPANGNEVWVEVFVCNQDSGQWSTLDMVLTQDQAIPEDKNYFYRGYSLRPNETKHPRLLLQAGDAVYVRVVTARVSVVVSTEEVVTPRVVADVRDQLSERINALAEIVQHITDVVREGVSI